jgi:hypothetical protein
VLVLGGDLTGKAVKLAGEVANVGDAENRTLTRGSGGATSQLLLSTVTRRRS